MEARAAMPSPTAAALAEAAAKAAAEVVSAVVMGKEAARTVFDIF